MRTKLVHVLALLCASLPLTTFAAANYVYHERTGTDVHQGAGNTCGGAVPYAPVLNPTSAQAYDLRYKVEYQFNTDRLRVYYTTDGSAPSGAFGVGAVGTLVVSGSYECTFTFGTDTIDICKATIPAQPAGTTVKYIVSAWKDLMGDEIFANSGTCGGCGNFNNSSLATVFQYTVAAPEIGVQQPAGTDLVDGAASIGFGNQNVGTPSAAKTFTITNSGNDDLTGLALTTDGSHPGDFAVGALGATTLAPGASTTFDVTFTPGCGPRSAALHIASNDGDENPFDIALTGTGVDVTPPVFNCGQNETVTCMQGWGFTFPIVTDNCDGLISGNAVPLSTTTNFTCGYTFVATRVWTVSDMAGNTTLCTQVVTYVDFIAPTITTCPASLTVPCLSQVPAPDVSSVTATNQFDPCETSPPVVVHFSDMTNGLVIIRTYRAYDGCSNSASCMQTITVQPPSTVYVDDDYTGLAAGTAVTHPHMAGGATHYIGCDAFATIQAGVDNVVGSTVLVAPGTYDGLVTISTDNLKLLSTGGKAVTILTNSSGTGLGTVVVVGPTTGVQIGDASQGFTIHGTDGPPGIEEAGIYFQGSHTDTEVIGNCVVAVGDEALVTESGATINNLTVTDNEFSGQTFVGPNPADFGFANQFTTPNVPRQLVVVSSGPGSGVTFSCNVVSGTAGGTNIALQPQGNQLVTIDVNNSTIQNNTFSGISTRFADGLRARGTGAIITGNIFTGGTPVGLEIGSAAAATAHVINNNFAATYPLAALGNGGASQLDAQSNWWGHVTGPAIASNPGGTGGIVGGNVDYSPWLGEATDTSGDCGFQPNAGNVVYTPATLTFSTQPGGALQGSPLSPQPVVTVLDEVGGTATQFGGAVSLAIGINPGGGTLSGLSSVNAVNGVATYAGLSINAGGAGYTLVATSTGLPGATSTAFDILFPVPVLATISPAFAVVGGAGITLTAYGSDFAPVSVVHWNGSPRATTFVSANQLTAAIPMADLAAVAAVPVTVVTPTPGGGTSAAINFQVLPVPTVVYVDDDFTPMSAGGHTWGYDAFSVVQDGVNAVAPGGTVHVAAGGYTEDVNVTKQVALLGAGIDLAIVAGVSNGLGATFQMAAAGSTLDGFTVTRQGNNPAEWNNNLNSVGVAIQTIGGVTVSHCKLEGNRTAIDINNSGGNTVVNNVLTNNRTGIIFRNAFTGNTVTGNTINDNWTVGVLVLNFSTEDATGTVISKNSISGNWYAEVENRSITGGLKNFSGNWLGSATLTFLNSNGGEPGYAAQIPVIFGGAATPPGGAPSIKGLGIADVDYTPWLDVGTDTLAAIGFQPDLATVHVDDDSAQVGPVTRIQEGAELVSGSTVLIAAGSYSENIVLTNTITLDGAGCGTGAGDTVITAASAALPVIHINDAGGTGAGDRLTLKDLRATGGADGIRATAVSAPRSFYRFDNVAGANNAGSGITFDGPMNMGDAQVAGCKLNDNGNSGLRIATTVPNFTGLEVTGGEMKNNLVHGLGVNAAGSDGTDASNHYTDLSVDGTTFENNGAAIEPGSGDLSFFRVNGNVTVKNVGITADGQFPIQLRGESTASPGTWAAAGTVLLQNVTIGGTGARPGLYIVRYSDVSTITIDTVSLAGYVPPSLPSGFASAMQVIHSGAAPLNLGSLTLPCNPVPAGFGALAMLGSGGATATCQTVIVGANTVAAQELCVFDFDDTNVVGNVMFPNVTVTCPSMNLTNECTSPAGAVVNYIVTGTSDCDPMPVVTCVPPSGSTFPLGVTTVDCVVVDNRGISNACSFTVTIIDTTAPMITCPANLLTNADAGLCFASAVNLGTPVISDACTPPVTVTNDAPSTFPVGVTPVVWTAIDGANNFGSCTQLVTVVEPIAPVITCPADVLVQCPASIVPPATGVATATDNCDTNPVVSFMDMNVATVTNGAGTWAIFLSGAPLTATANFVAGPGTPPMGSGSFRVSIGANGESIAELRNGSYAGTLVSAITELSYRTYRVMDGAGLDQSHRISLLIDSDNNGSGDDIIVFEPQDQDGDNPLLPVQGPIADNVWQHWDALAGGWWSVNNPGVMSPGAGVERLSAYVAAFPNARIVNGLSGGGVRVGTGGDSGIHDGYDGAVDRVVIGVSGVSTASNFELNPRNDCLPLIARTWKAADISGNIGYCTQIIDAQDTLPPSITCPANIVTNLPSGCSTVINYTTTTSDSCSNVTLICVPPSGSTFALGTNTVNCVAFDACGNSNACSFTITVNAAAPTITAQPQSQSTPMGNGVVFSVTANGTATLLYQWQTNGVNVTGANGTSLAISNLTLAQSGMQVQVIVANCVRSTNSQVAILTVTPITGIAFDFDTPGQFTNTPYAMAMNNFVNLALPSVPFEVSTGGVGVATGGGGLDLIFGSTAVSSSILHPVSFDFSLPGKTLFASAMVKIKAPAANDRAVQLGFTSLTNAELDNSVGRNYMTVILQATAQPNLTYQLRTGNKPNPVNSFQEGNNSANLTLVAGNWYKLSMVLSNNVLAQAGTYVIAASLVNMGVDGLTPLGTTATLGPVSVTNVDATATRNLFYVVRGRENSGNNFWDNFYAHTALGAPAFVAPPASQSIRHGRRTEFRALVDGEGPYTYQWFKNGGLISGARQWNYFTPPVTTADNLAEYSVMVTGPGGSVTSPPGTGVLTVLPDALDVVSVGSVDGCDVGLRFDQPIDPLTATNPANYLIDGMAPLAARLFVSPTDIKNVVPNGARVLLTPATMLSGPYTVTVTPSVLDLSGNPVSTNDTANGRIEGLTGVDINPVFTQPVGQQHSFGPGQIEISGGGADIWDRADSFRFAYKQVTGDFDVFARIPFVDVVRSTEKVGFNARASLDPFSPQVSAVLDPPPPARNFSEGTVEFTYNITASGWGSQTTVRYPDTWMRFRRAGSTFMRYLSTNGTTWVHDGQTTPTPAFPDTIYMGLAICAAANGNLATAWFENFNEFPGYAGATNIVITQQPSNRTTNAGSAVVLSALATLTGAPAGGELAYRWQRNNGMGVFTNMPTAGATNNTVNTGALFANDSGAQYRVVISASGALSVTSALATVTVTDTNLPTITAGIIPTNSLREIVLTYSEPMGASAINPANYSVTNGAGVSFGVASVRFLHGDPRTVLITTMNILTAGTYGVRVTGALDLNGLAVAPGSLRNVTQIGTAPTAPVVVEFYSGLNTNNPASLLDLTANAKFGNPDFIVYSNVFGINPEAANFPDRFNHYGVRVYTYFVPTNTGPYKFYMRADDFAEFRMNTNAVGSTNPAGAVVQVNMTGNVQTYTAVNSVTNFLTNGQRYYMEMRYKESSGGDGGTVAIRTGTDTNAPAQGEVIPGSLCVFPADLTPVTPVVVELYTGQVTVNSQATNNVGAAFGNGGLPDLIDGTNQLNFVTRLPNVIGYMRYLGFNTNLVQGNGSLPTFDNYLGRLYALFSPPSNGLYRFYIRNDDCAQLWMNTNSMNSDRPAGMNLLGEVNDFYNVNYTLVAQNVFLESSKQYYIEGRWREGTGGDGMTVTFRAQNDVTVPPNTEVILSNRLTFPVNNDRVGPVTIAAISPLHPTVPDGEAIVFKAIAVGGTPPYGDFNWFKNGVPVFANNPIFTNPPISFADNGAVFTLVVTNQFSSATATSIVTVLADGAAPTLVSAVGSQYQEFVTITFSEPVDTMMAACLANYSINNGVQVLDVAYDHVRRNRVTLRTTPQTPGAPYIVTVNGVKDASSALNVITPNSTINFTAWTFGGCGWYVELFTNIAGTAVADLTMSYKFQNNLPDAGFYTNRFGAGFFGAESGLNNYGARVSTYFMPSSNGLYQFYVRGDDGTQLYMNTNGPDSAGRVLIARNDGNNSGTWVNGTGLGTVGASVSPILSLNAGTAYYMEALLKEGGGSDHLEVIYRPINPGTLLPDPALPGTPALVDLNFNSPLLFAAPGNPDVIQFLVLSSPPTDVYTNENDLVVLSLAATILPSHVTNVACYVWSKETGPGSGVFTNIPGANLPSLSFFAELADDGVNYRLNFSLPTTNSVYTTTLHIMPDMTPPSIVSVASLNGTNIGICFSEPVEYSTGSDEFLYTVTSSLGFHGVITADRRSVLYDTNTVVLVVDPPLPQGEDFVVQAGDGFGGILDLAVTPNGVGFISYGTSAVQCLVPLDVGDLDNNAGDGESWTCKEGEIDVIAGGADIWTASDEGHLTLRGVSGNFDVWVQVKSLTRAPTDNDNITKAGVMVRESFDPAARKLHYLVEPPASIGGRDIYEAGQRPTTGAATAAWSGGNGNIFGPAGMPNTWVRIKRVGDIFIAFRSADGVNWIPTTTNTTIDLGPTVLVGLGTTAHVPSGNTNTTLAEYRNIHFPRPPAILAQPAPLAQVVPLHTPVSLSATVSNRPNAGPLTLQWFLNGCPIAGATSDTYSLADAMAADSGVYFLQACNDGGCSNSVQVSLVVSNALPVVGNDMLMVTQDLAISFDASNLLTNDYDPEGDATNLVAVSGIFPTTFAANFEDGLLPGGTAFFGTNPGGAVAGDGTGTNLALHLTDSPNTSAFGVLAIPDQTGGKTVNQLLARWRSRIGGATAGSAQFGRPGADGYSFTWGNDLPATPAYNSPGEEGTGQGLIATFDTWDAGAAEAPGIELKWRGVRVAFDNLVPGNQGEAKDFLRKDKFVDAQLTVDSAGVATLTYDGRTISATLSNWSGIPNGRFMFGGRTGGAVDNHWIDDVSITALTAETSRDYDLHGDRFGNTYITRQGGAGNSGVLRLTDNAINQAGSFIVKELTPTDAVQSFTASFLLRIGNGSAEPADGFSFNFAGDLPIGATTPAAAENGGGTGFSFCVDNYRFAPYPGGGTANSSGMKIRYGNMDIAGVQIPAWNSSNFVPVSISLAANGALTVLVDSTNVFGAVVLPWVPSTGRFGLYGRTGGQNETHWVDDLSIGVITAASSVPFFEDFNSGGPGTVILSNGVVTYTPPPDSCGADAFYYIASDGQQGGMTVGRVDVFIKEGTPEAPRLDACPPSRTITLLTSCDYVLPDLTCEFIVTDNCSVTLTQSPPAGSLLTTGVTVVTFTATDSTGTNVSCMATLTIVDGAAPILTVCATNQTLSADAACSAVLPDLRGQIVATDNCGIASITQMPAPGTVLGLGPVVVTLTVTDNAGNATNCAATVTVIDDTPPTVACPADSMVSANALCQAPIPDLLTGLLASDNCDSSLSLTQAPPAGTLVSLGAHTILITVTDDSGNSTVCTNLFTVRDTTPPVLVCRSVTLYLSNATVTLLPSDVVLSASDNCGTVNLVSVVPNTFECGGTYSVLLTANDGNGNVTTCTTNVTVHDLRFASSATNTVNTVVGTGVPDGDASGLVSSINVSTPIVFATGLKVGLNVSGTFNGDLYAWLEHSSGFSVLLNRAGRTAGNALGYEDDGFNVTLEDAAANGDIHVYRNVTTPTAGNPLTGAWAPDGRTNDPAGVLDTDSRTALLGSFLGINPNGEWNLFVADLESADLHTLQSWSLEIIGQAPGEPLAITQQPASQTVECLYGTAVFSVATTNLPATGYQWRFMSMALAGETGSSLTLTNPTYASQGGYDVVITHQCGSVTSAVAVLTVVDTTAPTILTCAPPAMVSADANCMGTVPDFTAMVAATDCTPPLTVTQSPLAGALVPLGMNTVVLTVTDASNNFATCNTTLTVRDTSGPVMGCPTNLIVECTSASGAIVNYTTTAIDNCDGPVAVACVPASGSLFPHGATVVNCSAVDSRGNSNSCSFTVTVRDTTPPVLCTDPPLVYTAGTVDNFTGPEPTTLSPDLQDYLINIDQRAFDEFQYDRWLGQSFTNLPGYIAKATLRFVARANGGQSESDNVTLAFAEAGGGLDPNLWSRRLGSVPGTPGLITNIWVASTNGTEFVLDLGRLPNSDGSFTDLIPELRARRYLDIIIQDDTEVDYIILEITTCPCATDLVVNPDPGQCGAIVNYPTPPFVDACDPTPTIVCTPPSGSFFPVGTTTVVCSATDAAGNRSFCTFNVTVLDIVTDPRLTIELANPSQVRICWPVTCATWVLEQTQVLANPGSGTMWGPVFAPVFPLGTNYCVLQPAGPGNRFYRLRRL